MPSVIESFPIRPKYAGESSMVTLDHDFASAGATDAIRLQRDEEGVIVTLSGTATAFTAYVERSTRDPDDGDTNWACADDTAWTGDLTGVVSPRIYDEPVRGWWRVRVASVTGGTVKVNMMGQRA